jgi:hypothetical protein
MSISQFKPSIVQVGSEKLAQMDQEALTEYGKPVSEFSYDEAALVVSGMVCALRGGLVKNSDGRAIVDSTIDGESAFIGASEMLGRELAPKIDDEREITLEVFGNLSFWNFIRKRKPEVVATYSFKNPKLGTS